MAFPLLVATVLPAAAFVLDDIEIEGLQRVAPGRVFAILPLQVYQDFDVNRSEQVLQDLYATGLFEDVTLKRRGNKLLIAVRERPGIKNINIIGNDSIEDEQLLTGLARANIAVGLVLDRLALERLRQELKEQYYAVGKYAARVDVDVDTLDANQVNVRIDINEGSSATIKEIRIDGNTRISDVELLETFTSGTTRWYEFWSSKDRYARAKLLADLDTMSEFYQDRGYLDFAVSDVNVELSPDKEDIFIQITVREGGHYRVGDTSVSNNVDLDRNHLLQQIRLRRNEIFSRRKAVQSSEAMRHLLRDNGYAFAQVNMVPEVREEEGIVDIAFIIKPGKLVYVRRINVVGNEDTDDEVFRREMVQMEGAKFSAGNLERSRRRLQRLPYVEAVEISDHAVADTNDQVDLDVQVSERFSGNFSIGAGYSDSAGALVSFSLNQENFLGSGYRVGATVRNDDSDTSYVFGFTDPYHTLSGVSRAVRFSYRSVDYEERDISNLLSSASDELRLGLDYGIPVSENDTFKIGAQVEDIAIELNDQIDVTNDINRREVVNCIRANAGAFTNLRLNSGIVYDVRDRAIFATEGTRIGAALQWVHAAQ